MGLYLKQVGQDNFMEGGVRVEVAKLCRERQST